MLFFSYCRSFCSHENDDKVKGIIIETQFPDLTLDSSNNKWVVSKYDPLYTRIYYYKNQTIIQSNFYYRKIKLGEDPKNIKYYSRYYSFIFSDSSDKGVLCDSNSLSNTKIVNKDSMLAKEWAFKTASENILEDNFHRLISSKINRDGDIEEYYSATNKKDTSMTGSILLVFSKEKVKGFDYSLSYDLDSIRKMKLVKTIYVNNARKLSEYMSIERMELSTELKEIKVENREDLLRMFNYTKTTLN